MSEPLPSKEQVDAARRAGFDAHSTHLPDDLRRRMADEHVRQTAKRDSNIRNFRAGVLQTRR